jgi:hypothetical protein
MTRYSDKAHDEAPDRRSDNARQRTRPTDQSPASPKAINALYAKGKIRPFGHAEGDGLVDRKTHQQDIRIQKPQDAIDGREKNYDNDCHGYVRAAGEDATKDRPGGFDHGKYDLSSKPQKATGPRNTARGSNLERSPFSAAAKTWIEKD